MNTTIKTLLLFVFIAVSSSTAVAQRTIDLALDSIYAPDTVYHQVDTYYEFSVKNNGPDTIMPGDTIIYNLIIRDFTDDVYFPCEGCHFSYYPSKNYVPGDTIMISGSHAKVGLVHNFIREYCASADAIYKTLYNTSDPKKINEEIPNKGVNNSKCQYIYYKRYNFNLRDIVASSGIATYPNPTHDVLKIEIAETTEQLKHARIYDMTGQLLLDITTSDTKPQIDISAVPNGIYLLRVSFDHNIYQTKFIINH